MIRDAVDFNPFRYCGEYYDTETGLIYLRARYYDPNTGRFISQDPHWNVKNMIYGDNPDDKNPVPDLEAIIQSGNLYAYCLNNPTNLFDSNGQWLLPNWAKVVIGAAAISGLAVATVCTGGATAVICGAALSGAITGGASGAVIGAVSGGISDGWKGALNGACSGFMSGTLIGGATSAAFAGLNIATGATVLYGKPHGSILHKLAIKMEAGKMAASGRYSIIGVNKSLKTMGLNGIKRPDVIGIAKNGVHKLVEVVSPKQKTNEIISKMAHMLNDNPGSIGRIVTWVRRLFK